MCEIIVSMYSCEKFTCKSTLERRFRSLTAFGAPPNREVCSDALMLWFITEATTWWREADGYNEALGKS